MLSNSLRKCAALLLALVGILFNSHHTFGVGQIHYVATNAAAGSFSLFDRTPAPLLIASNDWPGVIRATTDLAKDVERVTGSRAEMFHQPNARQKHAVIIGTVGRSALIDQLVLGKKIDVSDISGKWESFMIQVVPHPFPDVDSALIICGSDKRGTIYGIYDLSEQIGVSPWHYWNDVPAKRHDRLYIQPGRFVTGPPSVKYRGIFINDEAPALSGWIAEKYGNVEGLRGVANYGRGFYTNIFELMLRIRANYLWPAMWNNAFNEDDPENPRLADEYGIVMGTSHQEPMLRAQKEWDRGPGRTHGNWNYNNTNQQPVLQQFWRDGVRRNRNFENIITMGLRAENDSGAPVGKEKTEEIVNIQRKILGAEINEDLTKVPQVWCLYKEVMDYYSHGLRVPDDVTLLWAEDNWGNVRRLPTAEERHRSGGAGVYYHFDYHGGPRSYQWINTSPISKIWDQMTLAKQYGADRIWIVNVGHFNKSSEFPLEFFMSLGWDTARWNQDNLDEFTHSWSAREFGSQYAGVIAQLINDYTRFNGRRKPELLDANTYSLANFREFETVTADYQKLSDQAQEVYTRLPQDHRDAFYSMVHYPIKAAAGLHAMYLAAAKNQLYSEQGRASANDFALETRSLFAAQTNLAGHFNREFAGGKWNHFMDQTYIGYRSWDPPRANNLGAIRLAENTVAEAPAMGVAVEGETSTTGGALAFHKFGRAERFIDVFNQGRNPFSFTSATTAPWLVLNQTNGSVEKDLRLSVQVDWAKAPSGESKSQITFSGANTNFTVNVSVFNPTEPASNTIAAFVEADGYVSIEAEHYTRKTEAASNRWIRIPNYGHTLSGMRAVGPTETLAKPNQNSPCLEYGIYFFTSGKVELQTTVGPTLNFMPGRPLRYAISFDDEEPQTITVVPANFDAHNGNRDWEESVKNNFRRIVSTHSLATPGYHTLKLWMVDPALVLQKIVANTGGAKPSYLGPPESFRTVVRQ